jgi:hypothetical protein
MSFMAYPQVNSEKCVKSLAELVEAGKVPKEKLNKFLEIQAGLTMHKLAYALFRNDVSRESFKLEEQILAMTKQVENQSDPEFVAAREMFEKNPLSRTALSKILPHIEHILNDQIDEQNPIKRQYFTLGMSDIKMLAILAEKERKFASGKFDHRLYRSHTHDNSILNFTKIINSSIRGTNDSKENVKKTMARRVRRLHEQANSLIASIDLGDDCTEIKASCLKEIDGKPVINENFLNIIVQATESLQGVNRHKYLRYGDVWLYTKGGWGNSSSGSGRRRRVTKGNPTPRVKVMPPPPKKKSDQRVIDEYLADHVMDYFPYFFTKEKLLANKELMYALAKAIDEGKIKSPSGKDSYFVYKGKKYKIPEMWNVGYTGNRAKKAVTENLQGIRLFFISDDVDVPANIPENLHDEFLATRKEAKYVFGHQHTFEFKGAYYDLKTGKKLDKDPSAFLAYPIGPTDEDSYDPFKDMSPTMKKKIADEIRDDNHSYMDGNVVRYISGTQVKFDRAYRQAKKRYSETNKHLNPDVTPASFASSERLAAFVTANPEHSQAMLKGLADGDNAVVTGSGVINMVTLRVMKKDEAIDVIEQYRKSTGADDVSRDVAATHDLSYTYARTAAIINNDDSFEHDGHEYFSHTGRKMQDEYEAPLSGYINFDRYNDRIVEINSKENADLIREYHKFFRGHQCSYYSYLDKKDARVYVYKNNGTFLDSFEVLIGSQTGDEKTIYKEYPARVTNNKTGAGVFSFGDVVAGSQSEFHSQYEGNFLTLDPDKEASGEKALAMYQVSTSTPERNTLFNDNNTDNNRVSNGGIVFKKDEMGIYQKKYGGKGCPFYILPEGDKVKFKVQDGRVTMVAGVGSSLDRPQDYNLSPKPKVAPKKIKIQLKDQKYNNDLTQKYLKAMEDEKSQLMTMFGLTNEEYNELTKLSFGIMGVESGFGTEKAYKIKEKRVQGMEVGQWIVDIMKGSGSSSNSRGLTQIKDVREYLRQSYPEIQESNLTEPRNAAIATMAVLAHKIKDLKRIEGNHTHINEQNRMEYLYYIYMGSANQIIQGGATPALNAKAREVLGYADAVTVYSRP